MLQKLLFLLFGIILKRLFYAFAKVSFVSLWNGRLYHFRLWTIKNVYIFKRPEHVHVLVLQYNYLRFVLFKL